LAFFYYLYSMKVGSVVECINAAFNERQKELIAFLPDRGKLYMVRSVEEHQSKKVGIRLEEIINPPSVVLNGVHIEPTFDIERFREVEGLDDLVIEMIEETFCEFVK